MSNFYARQGGYSSEEEEQSPWGYRAPEVENNFDDDVEENGFEPRQEQ